MDCKEPAFPRDHRYVGHNGITMRDYFAGQMLCGIGDFKVPAFSNEELVEMCQQIYRIADAMMEARK